MMTNGSCPLMTDDGHDLTLLSCPTEGGSLSMEQWSHIMMTLSILCVRLSVIVLWCTCETFVLGSDWQAASNPLISWAAAAWSWSWSKFDYFFITLWSCLSQFSVGIFLYCAFTFHTSAYYWEIAPFQLDFQQLTSYCLLCFLTAHIALPSASWIISKKSLSSIQSILKYWSW